MSLSGSASWIDSSIYKTSLTTTTNQSGTITFDARPPVAFIASWYQTISSTNGGVLTVTFGDTTNAINLELTHGGSSVYRLYHNSTLLATSSSVNISAGTYDVLAKFRQLGSRITFKLNEVLIFDKIDVTNYKRTYENGIMKATATTNASQSTTQIISDMCLAPILEITDDVYIGKGLYAEDYMNLPTSSSQWTTTGRNIKYDSSGNVGIGKNPIYTLDVSGNIRANRYYGIQYTDISGAPTISQIQSDWDVSDNTSLSFIRNKPQLATVAYDGFYSSLKDRPTKLSDFQYDISAGDPNFTEDVYVGNDKTPPYRVDNVIGRENLYTWWGDAPFYDNNTESEPFYSKYTGGVEVFRRITNHGGALINMGHATGQWNNQYMFEPYNHSTDSGGNLSTPTAYTMIKMPSKTGVSLAFFVKIISYDRWSTPCIFVTNKARDKFYRLQTQTNSYQSVDWPYVSWIGPNGEPSPSQRYHEWVMFSIPQYIVDEYTYAEPNDNKSKYGQTINICYCRNANGGCWTSGLAMRINPYGLTFHNGLCLHWAVNGGNGTAWHSVNWNNELMNQWSSGTNYVNIRVPICPPRDPASSPLPDFYMVFVAHTWDWDTWFPVYLYNPNTGASQLLGRWSKNIKGRYGMRLVENLRHAMGVLVPSPDPQYIVYAGGRPYLNIRYDLTGTNTAYTANSHCRGIFTEVVNQSGDPNGYDPYDSRPLVQGTIYITANQANLNLYNYFVSNFGIPPSTVRIVINPTVTIYSNNPSLPALDIGQFPKGTSIFITNQGKIHAEGGTAGVGGTVYGALPGTGGGATNGGKGGDAVKADYLNQIVSITNTGQIWAGGGGSGGGGKGANGTSYYTINWGGYGGYYSGPYWRWSIDNYIILAWSGKVSKTVSNIGNVSEYTYNGITYVRGTTVREILNDEYGPYSYYYDIGEKVLTTAVGGNGANGVRGRGYGYSGTLTGTNGSAGVSDAQTGGSSGNAGDWAQAGNAGTGTYPGQGGVAGFALVKGVANVTIDGTGSVLGQTSTTSSGTFTSLITTFGSSVDNFNLYNYIASTFGTPTGAFTLNFTIGSSAVIKSTNTNTPAFDVGQFPTGSVITIINLGKIFGCQGAGGSGQTTSSAATAGGNGGVAIKATYSNQTVTITNGATGLIYGGGGGGGGGSKGIDGVAGQNVVAPRTQYGTGYGWYVYWTGSVYRTYAFWDGEYVMDTEGLYYEWVRGSGSMAGRYTQQGYEFSYGEDPEVTDVYAIQRSNATWYGGSAGVGGSGGTGAKGRGGTNQSVSLTGGDGIVGTAGGIGENNAIGTTNGTTGQIGQTGGTGGDWGQPGSAGSGASGGAGGAAGAWLLKSTASVTWSNTASDDALKGGVV